MVVLFFRLFRFPLLNNCNTIPEPNNEHSIGFIGFQVYPIFQYGVPQAGKTDIKCHAHNYGAGVSL